VGGRHPVGGLTTISNSPILEKDHEKADRLGRLTDLK